jgi:hypothetical protein
MMQKVFNTLAKEFNVTELIKMEMRKRGVNDKG